MSTQTATNLPVTPHCFPLETGQCVILRGVSWGTYEHLLADFQDSHTAHFTYDRGVLEIMVLSFEHEKLNRLIHDLFTLIALEMDLEFVNAGSTTFKRLDLSRGSEPDTCFYVQHAGQIQDKDSIDLSVDPPPDLVIEIDITSPSLDKLPIYAQIGVSEIWRYDGDTLTIFRLEGGSYTTSEESLALAGVTSSQLSQFIADSRTMTHPALLRLVRDWARQQAKREK